MIHVPFLLVDQTIIASYSEFIQHYEFALPHCRGKYVLDAGGFPWPLKVLVAVCGKPV